MAKLAAARVGVSLLSIHPLSLRRMSEWITLGTRGEIRGGSTPSLRMGLILVKTHSIVTFDRLETMVLGNFQRS